MSGARRPIKTYTERGAKRVFAGALDWPGWCRGARDEEGALEALAAYGPRYAGGRAGNRSHLPPARRSGRARRGGARGRRCHDGLRRAVHRSGTGPGAAERAPAHAAALPARGGLARARSRGEGRRRCRAQQGSARRRPGARRHPRTRGGGGGSLRGEARRPAPEARRARRRRGPGDVPRRVPRRAHRRRHPWAPEDRTARRRACGPRATPCAAMPGTCSTTRGRSRTA